MTQDVGSVLVENQGAVQTVTLNRPDVLNALNWDLSKALEQALREADEDATVRCLVITGAGRAFCSGQDLIELTSSYKTDEPIRLERRLRFHYLKNNAG